MTFFEKALEIWKSTSGTNSYDVALAYNNIGYMYYSLGDFFEALKFYQMCIDIRKSVLGEDHPETIKTQERIAEIQAKMKAQENETKE